MKCAACGYEYSPNGIWIDKVHRYKSGKRKGEVKDIEKIFLDTTIGHAPFKEICFKKDVDSLCIYEEGQDYNSTTTVQLYGCPEYNTVRFE